MTAALINAGGLGSRMRESGVSVPKPLVAVQGIPLLEHNVRWLLKSGVTRLSIVHAQGDEAIVDFIEHRCRSIADKSGAQLMRIEEPIPLGNIGILSRLPSFDEPLLVAFADNLTTLDPLKLVAQHLSSQAVLTSAIHRESFRIPYGVVEVKECMIRQYTEKPEVPILVSSGTYVISPMCATVLKPDEPLGISQLITRLLHLGLPVGAYEHSARWVDVNDATSLARAEQLLNSAP